MNYDRHLELLHEAKLAADRVFADRGVDRSVRVQSLKDLLADIEMKLAVAQAGDPE